MTTVPSYDLPLWADALVATLLVVGALTTLLGAYGLAKFSRFYLRVHAPTKSTTLGVGGVLIASAIWFGVRGGAPVPRELLITLFVFLTAPISAHLLFKAALRVAGPNDASPPA